MDQLKMFCLCIHNDLLPKFRNIDYIPVGLGSEQFDKGLLTDKTGETKST